MAVASDEAGRSGRPDAWKRDRLIGVGADLVIPDYRDWRVLLRYLWEWADTPGEPGAVVLYQCVNGTCTAPRRL